MAFRQFERTSLQLSMGTLLSCLCASVAYADTLAPVKPATVDACVALASNADRLACYDSVFKPSALPAVQAAAGPVLRPRAGRHWRDMGRAAEPGRRGQRWR